MEVVFVGREMEGLQGEEVRTDAGELTVLDEGTPPAFAELALADLNALPLKPDDQ